MKRYIRSSKVPAITGQLSEAKEVLAKYSEEQIELVRECIDEENAAISDYYTEDNEYSEDYGIGSELSDIKRDYASQAYEDDLLTLEEFDEIHQALETLDTESAVAYA